MNPTHTFQVPGLNCGHCVAVVTQALGALGARVQANPASKQVEVSAPSDVSREQLAQALAQAGYPPAS